MVRTNSKLITVACYSKSTSAQIFITEWLIGSVDEPLLLVSPVAPIRFNLKSKNELLVIEYLLNLQSDKLFLG